MATELRTAPELRATTELRATPELLSPCGSPDALDAALLGGADAVYIGGTMLNARMNAKNFANDALRAAVEKCHAQGVRLYVTMNTQVYDREMNAALQYAAFLYEAGVDALIVTDLGLISLLRTHLPDFELHGSTQMSGHNAEAARKMAELGLSRMVCARELSEKNIRTLVENSPIEIEMFVHGALCVSHSGQCLLSSVIGGRSGNRGECAQPCRMKYNNNLYPLSLKDNCLAGHIPALLNSGAASLKIEGRMKSPDYVYGVTAAYRQLIDEGRPATAQEINRLAALFSRSGFTDGYFTGKIGPDMIGIRSDSDKAASAEVRTSFKPSARKADPIITPERHAEIPEKVESRAAPRRIAPFVSASFEKADQIPDNCAFDRVYLPLSVYVRSPLPKYECGITLPPVITDEEIPAIEQQLDAAFEKGARHALVGNIGHLELARRHGFILHGDFRLNIYNLHAQRFWEQQGMVDTILSPELTLPQIRDIGGEKAVVCYGRLPVMLLEKKVGPMVLRDRTGAEFPIIRCGERDILLNSVPVYMADKQDLIEKSGGYRKHFLFTNETRRDAAAVMDCYRRKLQPKGQTRRIK